MILLDMRTIVFSNVLIYIACTAIIVLLWRQTRQRFAGTVFWVFYSTLQTAALFLLILRGTIPDGLSIVVANTMIIAGAIMGYMGLERFVGEKSNQIYNYIFLVLFAGVHAYFTWINPNLAARNLNISVGMLVICFQCMWLMLYRVESGSRSWTSYIGIVFIGYCVVSIVRIVQFFSAAQQATEYFHSGFFEPLVMISYQILFILLTHSLVVMFNNRLLMEVRVQEEKFSKAFHSSPYAIMITRLSDGRIIEVNDGFVNITGYQLKDVLGETTLAVHLWCGDEDRATVVNELSAGGKVQGREFQFRKKSGELLTGLFSAEIITINNEKCILSSINDITEIQQAKQSLHESREYLENLLSYANAPIIVWDNNFRITKFNKAFERLSGRNVAEVLGREVDILFPSAMQEKYLESIKRINAGERWENVELEIRHVDSGIRTVLWNSAVIYAPDGKTVVATIAQGHDITERKKAQEEIVRLNADLEQKVVQQTRELRDSQLALLNVVDDLNMTSKRIAIANQSLEAVNKELAAFSYSVSHDLRAPLRSIDGFSSALQEDCRDMLSDEGKNYLERIRRATQNMGLLIDDMLNLSRVTQSEFYSESVDLSKMVRSIAETLEQKEAKNMTLTIQEGVVIQADKRLMHIALTNLLDNAWKFTGKREQPRIEFGTEVKDGKTVIFVRDNGVGFDMAYVGKLFGAFQRLHRSDEFPGTGIGLATVQRIIHRHGGHIWAEGEPEKGATFYFTLVT